MFSSYFVCFVFLVCFCLSVSSFFSLMMLFEIISVFILFCFFFKSPVTMSLLVILTLMASEVCIFLCYLILLSRD